MKRFLKLLVVPFLVLFLFTSGAWALNLGTDITIFDNRFVNANWHDGSYDLRVDSFNNHVSEDDEVEPGMQHGQQWDLEGFFLNGSILSMIGGWNFEGTLSNYTSGDIFIDVDGNVTYGVDDDSTAPGMGYEYVIDIDWGAGTYNAYSLTGVDNNQYEQTVYNSPESDPWQFNPDGSDSKLYTADKSFAADLLTDGNYQNLFLGTNHYYASGFDLSFIYLADNSWDGVFTSHFTMECGNDNLMGNGTAPVPEPATMLLLGTGLLGIAGVGRKKLLKK